MNCGMNAPKNTSTFGFDSSTSKPLQEETATRWRRRRVRRGAIDAGRRISLMPIQIRYAAPASRTQSNQ